MPPMFAYCVFRMMNNGFNDGQFDGELQFLLSIAANFANQNQTSRGSFIDQVRIKPFHAGENSETINKQVLRWNRQKSAQNRPFVFVSNAVTLKKIWFCLRINIHKNRSFCSFFIRKSWLLCCFTQFFKGTQKRQTKDLWAES